MEVGHGRRPVCPLTQGRAAGLSLRSPLHLHSCRAGGPEREGLLAGPRFLLFRLREDSSFWGMWRSVSPQLSQRTPSLLHSHDLGTSDKLFNLLVLPLPRPQNGTYHAPHLPRLVKGKAVYPIKLPRMLMNCHAGGVVTYWRWFSWKRKN